MRYVLLEKKDLIRLHLYNSSPHQIHQPFTPTIAHGQLWDWRIYDIAILTTLDRAPSDLVMSNQVMFRCLGTYLLTPWYYLNHFIRMRLLHPSKISFRAWQDTITEKRLSGRRQQYVTRGTLIMRYSISYHHARPPNFAAVTYTCYIKIPTHRTTLLIKLRYIETRRQLTSWKKNQKRQQTQKQKQK